MQMRETLVSVSGQSCLSAGNRLQFPQAGPWPLELSRPDSAVCASPDCEKCPHLKDARPSPSCGASKRRMLMSIRGITQLARRLDVWGDHECTWLLLATHNSDEVRPPESRRKSVRVSGRRLVRGSPLGPESTD